jgi:Ni,Fe-hydrogenase III large subunit
MKLVVKQIPNRGLSRSLKTAVHEGKRLGLLTSTDGRQLTILLLDTASGAGELWQSPVERNTYSSLTLRFPQLHWSERILWDMFGIVPKDHPRLKPVLMHSGYPDGFYPLRQVPLAEGDLEEKDREFNFLEVAGDGVWELPVGPIHAGVIEPGHFRFSCLGETILNLEISLGYVHRGVEKRLTEVPWRKARFVAESCASDTAVANALAHAIAIESLFEVAVPEAAQILRSIALELERVCMHIIDIGGMAADVGMVGVAASMGRLRGRALGLAQALSGSRFMRSFVLPGGVTSEPTGERLRAMESGVAQLRQALKPLIDIFEHDQKAIERFEGVGKVKKSLASEFGFVGVAARACGIAYDTRQHFAQGVFPKHAPPVAMQEAGDVLARTRVRIQEVWNSLDVIEQLLPMVPPGKVREELPDRLPADSAGAAVVEAFRGELIHLLLTDSQGKITRYAIKDPSLNNWTGVSIAVRDNLIADFPLVNKSNSLSYSGNDL